MPRLGLNCPQCLHEPAIPFRPNVKKTWHNACFRASHDYLSTPKCGQFDTKVKDHPIPLGGKAQKKEKPKRVVLPKLPETNIYHGRQFRQTEAAFDRALEWRPQTSGALEVQNRRSQPTLAMSYATCV